MQAVFTVLADVSLLSLVASVTIVPLMYAWKRTAAPAAPMPVTAPPPVPVAPPAAPTLSDPWEMPVAAPPPVPVAPPAAPAPALYLLPPAPEKPLPAWTALPPQQLRQECQQRGIKWRNAHGKNRHLSKREMVAALEAVLAVA